MGAGKRNNFIAIDTSWPNILFWRISPSERSVAPLSNLLSLLEQASVRKDEVAATTCLTGGAGALPRGQQFFFGELVLLIGQWPPFLPYCLC